MPVAHLLGWFRRHPPGFQEWMPDLQCLREQNFAYIGLRDIDPVEGSMLRKSGLHLFTMREVDKFGVASCIEQALQRIDPQGTRPIHLSLDVDGIDPSCAPGTGTQARGGLSYREIHYICEEVALTRRLVSMDLVEINPGLDRLQGQALHGDDPDLKTTTQTVQLGVELALSALGKTILGDVALDDAKPQATDGDVGPMAELLEDATTGSVPPSVTGPAPHLGGAPSAHPLNGA
jgi:arginase